MVDTTKESTCYPVNSNDEIVLTDGDGDNAVVSSLPNKWIPISPTNKRMKVVLPDNISRQWHGWVDYNDTATQSSPLIYKSSGTYRVHAITSLYIGNALTLNNPGEIYIVSDHSASVKVGGFFIKYTLQPRAAT